MIVSLEEFQKYTGVYGEEKDESASLYISAAQDILASYLGYAPEKQRYIKMLSGHGLPSLRVGVKPIVSVESISVNGSIFESSDFYFFDDTIFFKDTSKIFAKGSNITVDFFAGFEEIPAIMKMTVLRIAALLQLESDSNIGVSSRSFGDSTRTFLNTTNYEKYLIQCSRYKLLY